MTTRTDRARGALLGLAWGDAFGCPVEGWRAAQIATVYGAYTALPEAYPLAAIAPMGARTLRRLRPLGLHSDDTQQALGLLQVALRPEGWALPEWGQLLVDALEAKAWRGFGRNFSAAVHRLRKGVAPGRAGSPSAGMGAAMRIGPLGVVFADDRARLAEVCMGSSLITHGDLRAGAIAFAVAHAVADLVEGRSTTETLARLAPAVAAVEHTWIEQRPDWQFDRGVGPQVSTALRLALDAPLGAGPAALGRWISKGARAHLAKGFTRAHPNQGFALLGGLHGLLSGLRAAEPQVILAEVVQQGFDTDTVAAITGTVLGARFGTGWLPMARLLDGPRLAAYADALVGGPLPEGRAAFLAAEAAWTAQSGA